MLPVIDRASRRPEAEGDEIHHQEHGRHRRQRLHEHVAEVEGPGERRRRRS
jgi:hypothetical protein